MLEKIMKLKYSKIGGGTMNVSRVREMWKEYDDFFFISCTITFLVPLCTFVTFLIPLNF